MRNTIFLLFFLCIFYKLSLASDIEWIKYGGGIYQPYHELSFSDGSDYMLALVKITNHNSQKFELQVWNSAKLEKNAEISGKLYQSWDISYNGLLVAYSYKDDNQDKYFEIRNWKKNKILAKDSLNASILDLQFFTGNEKIVISWANPENSDYNFLIYDYIKKTIEKNYIVDVDNKIWHASLRNFELSANNHWLLGSYTSLVKNDMNIKNNIFLVNLDNGKIKKKKISNYIIKGFAISQDAKYSAAFANKKTYGKSELIIIDNEKWVKKNHFNNDDFRIDDFKFNKSGNVLKAISKGNGIKYYDIENNKQLLYMKNNDWAYAFGFLEDDFWITYDDCYVSLFKLQNDSIRLESQVSDYDGYNHIMDINDIDISPDNHYIASAGTDRTRRLWKSKDGVQIKKFNNKSSTYGNIEFSPDGKYLAAATYQPLNKLEILNTGDFTLSNSYDFRNAITDICWSADDSRIAVHIIYDSVFILNAYNGKKEFAYFDESSYESSIAISKDGKWLAIGNNITGTLSVIDIDTKKIIHKKAFNDRGVFDNMEFFKNDSLLLVSYGDFYTRIYDTESWGLVKKFGKLRNSFMSNGNKYLIGTNGSEILIFDYKSEMEIKRYEPIKDTNYFSLNYITTIALSPDNTHIIGGTSYGDIFQLKVLETSSVEELTKISSRPHFYVADPVPTPAKNKARAKIYWDTEFDVENASKQVYDILGSRIGNGSKIKVTNIQPHSAEVVWDCSSVSQGVYFIGIEYYNSLRTIPVVVGD